MERRLFRITPALPVQAFTTYQVSTPPATHARPATCAEVECQAQANGWRTTVDVGTELGRRQANYIRLQSGRTFTATEAGTLVTFEFPAGQRCFTEHRVSLERPAFYLKRGGDWRGATSPARRMSAQDWVDDFAEHQQGLADHRTKG
jgi:hypothetical protein